MSRLGEPEANHLFGFVEVQIFQKESHRESLPEFRHVSDNPFQGFLAGEDEGQQEGIGDAKVEEDAQLLQQIESVAEHVTFVHDDDGFVVCVVKGLQDLSELIEGPDLVSVLLGRAELPGDFTDHLGGRECGMIDKNLLHLLTVLVLHILTQTRQNAGLSITGLLGDQKGSTFIRLDGVFEPHQTLSMLTAEIQHLGVRGEGKGDLIEAPVCEILIDHDAFRFRYPVCISYIILKFPYLCQPKSCRKGYKE